MFHPDYLRAINIAANLHEKMRDRINIRKKDKKLAIFLLQGSQITHSYLALKAWKNGDLNSIFRAKRFIDESMELALFFSVLSDNDRYIKRWFDDKIIEIPNLNSSKNRLIKKAILKKTGWNEQTFKSYQEKKKRLYQEFSKGPHPNFSSVAFNFDKRNFKFNYQCDKLAFYPIPNFDFASFVIIPTLQSIAIHADLISLDPVEFVLLRSWIARIEKISKAIYTRRQTLKKI